MTRAMVDPTIPRTGIQNGELLNQKACSSWIHFLEMDLFSSSVIVARVFSRIRFNNGQSLRVRHASLYS